MKNLHVYIVYKHTKYNDRYTDFDFSILMSNYYFENVAPIIQTAFSLNGDSSLYYYSSLLFSNGNDTCLDIAEYCLKKNKFLEVNSFAHELL